MGWVTGEHNIIFYADAGKIGWRYHIWVQDALTVSVPMLQLLRLETNLYKTKALVCTPGYIWGKWSEAAYKRRANGEGATFRERKRARVSCTVCRVAVAVLYLEGHMERQYVRSPPQKR